MKVLSIAIISSLLMGQLAYGDIKAVLSDAEANDIVCGDETVIVDHMKEMGFIIRKLSESVTNIIEGTDDEQMRIEVIEHAQKLRVHMSAVFSKTPEKIKKIKQKDSRSFQKNKLIFQKYMLHMMSKTVELEEELLVIPSDPFSAQAQRVKVANIILNIQETIDEAHSLFRD